MYHLDPKSFQLALLEEYLLAPRYRVIIYILYRLAKSNMWVIGFSYIYKVVEEIVHVLFNGLGINIYGIEKISFQYSIF